MILMTARRVSFFIKLTKRQKRINKIGFAILGLSNKPDLEWSGMLPLPPNLADKTKPLPITVTDSWKDQIARSAILAESTIPGYKYQPEDIATDDLHMQPLLFPDHLEPTQAK